MARLLRREALAAAAAASRYGRGGPRAEHARLQLRDKGAVALLLRGNTHEALRLWNWTMLLFSKWLPPAPPGPRPNGSGGGGSGSGSGGEGDSTDASGGGGGGDSKGRFGTVAAATLMAAVADMGWTKGNVGQLTGADRAAQDRLIGAATVLFNHGLCTAWERQQAAPGGGSASANELACPPAAVANLAAAMRRLGVRVSAPKLRALEERALLAALRGGGAWPRLGYGAAIWLLESWVRSGADMPGAVLVALCECLQAHLLQQPQRLLPLLRRLAQLSRGWLWVEGQEALQRVQSVLFGSRLPGELLWPVLRQLEDLLDASKQLRGEQDARARALVEATEVLSQLHAATLPRGLVNGVFFGEGARLLAQASRDLRGAEGRPRRAHAEGEGAGSGGEPLGLACCLSPAHCAAWLAALAKLRHHVEPEQKKAIACALLDYAGELAGRRGAWPPGALLPLLAAANELELPAAAGPEWWEFAVQAVQLELERYSPAQALQAMQLMEAGGYKPKPEVLEEHLVPAASLPFRRAAAGSPGRSGVRERAWPPSLPQLIELLELLARFNHVPRQPGWWDDMQTALMSGGGGGSGKQQRQEGRQAAQGAGPPLAPGQAVALLWSAGRLRAALEPRVFSWLLEPLERDPAALRALTRKQRVDVFVGLAKLVPKCPGVLRPGLYQRLCELLPGARLFPNNIANVMRCMGSIADSSAGGGVAGAAVAARLGGPGAGAQGAGAAPALSGAQEPLRPPGRVVMRLLAEVEPHLRQGLKGRALSMLPWSMRKLGMQLPPAWVESYQQAIMSHLPELADYELVIAFSCLVHVGARRGAAVDPGLLQAVLDRGPRLSFSPGIVADLQAALDIVEGGRPLTPAAAPAPAAAGRQGAPPGRWHGSGGGATEGEREEYGGPLASPQEQHAAAAGSADDGQRRQERQRRRQQPPPPRRPGSDAAEEDDIDALVDRARGELGAFELWSRPPGARGVIVLPALLGGEGAEVVLEAEEWEVDEDFDEEAARRVKQQVALANRLLGGEAEGGGGGGAAVARGGGGL